VGGYRGPDISRLLLRAASRRTSPSTAAPNYLLIDH